MQELFIYFQHNTRARDLAYELSAAYLPARSLHLAVEINIFANITDNGTPIKTILSAYPDYDVAALVLIIDILVAHGFLSMDIDKNVFHTPISKSLANHNCEAYITTQQWQDSYDVNNALSDTTEDVNITLKDHCLIYQSTSARAITLEFTRLHLLARAIRFTTAQDILEYYSQQRLPIRILEQHRIFINIFKLLSRYHLLNYQADKELMAFSAYTSYLLKSHPESLYYAMFMIDEKWWKAAAVLRQGLQKHSLPAYELANQHKFYETANNHNHFARGMAAISLLEDQDVANASYDLFTDLNTIVDVGGGEGGLLSLYRQQFGDKKRYILYDMTTPTNPKTEIVLGDFMHPPGNNNIPQLSRAAYIIKCVLHNMQRNDVITLLRHIRVAMKEDCQLFIAERVLPPNYQRPHANLSCNLLMQLLFKAETHDSHFYQDVINTAGFNLNKMIPAGNYMVFSLTEKPELKFNKTSPLRTSFSLSSTTKSSTLSDTTTLSHRESFERR